MRRRDYVQEEMWVVDWERLVPQDHLLRRINEAIDFKFIYDKVRHLYSHKGRPSVDPVVLVKMLLIGYLYGIPSERRLEQEVNLNLAYRWFVGLQLSSQAPDHSTFSQNRRRFSPEVFQEIFNHVVERCVERGLVTGELVAVDATHVKANVASRKNEATIQVTKTPSAYLLELEAEAQRVEDTKLKVYASDKAVCAACSLRAQCIPRTATVKNVTRPLFQMSAMAVNLKRMALALPC